MEMWWSQKIQQNKSRPSNGSDPKIVLYFVWVGGRSRAGGRLQRSSVVEETNGDTLSTDAIWYFLRHFLARRIKGRHHGEKVTKLWTLSVAPFAPPLVDCPTQLTLIFMILIFIFVSVSWQISNPKIWKRQKHSREICYNLPRPLSVPFQESWLI